MNYDKEKTEERLRHVPKEHRVFIYNASIIIEFLNQTLMPLYYFLKPEAMQKISNKLELDKKQFIRSEDYEEKLTMGDLYDFYKMFRQQTSYTAPVESKYKFSIILKSLDYVKNGWQFERKRVGRAQLIYFKPAQIRVKVHPELRRNFPPLPVNLSQAQIGMTIGDHSEEEEETKDTVHAVKKVLKKWVEPELKRIERDRWKEAKGSRFIEAKGKS